MEIIWLIETSIVHMMVKKGFSMMVVKGHPFYRCSHLNPLVHAVSLWDVPASHVCSPSRSGHES